MEPWLEALRRRYIEEYAARDWRAHVSGLNARLGLEGRTRFTESAWPPDFFWGALPRFRPGEWLAAISLNPKEMPESDREWHESQEWTAEAYWDYLCREDLRGWPQSSFYYRKWAHPFVVFLAELRGDPSMTDRPQDAFFGSVGSFEIIPYASHEYEAGTFPRMADDPGAQFARELALTAIRACPPAAIIANGSDAADAVMGWLPLDAPASPYRYESASRPGRMLRHSQASITLGSVAVPVIGIPFWRTQGGHNSYDEIRQLAREVRSHLG